MLEAKDNVWNYKLPFFQAEQSHFSDKESFIEWTRKVFLTNGDLIVPTFNDSHRNDLLTKFSLSSIKHMLGFQADFHETSMITGKGVDDSIRTLVNHLYEQSRT